MNLQAREGAPLNRYYDPYFACDAVKLLPGEYFASGEDLVIVTVLGSCVSVCLRDPLNGIAGMNHFMLPERGLGGDPASPSARYGSHAMELLINRMLALGASRERLQAKVFGGGSVLRQISAAIGQRNVEFTSTTWPPSVSRCSPATCWRPSRARSTSSRAMAGSW